MKEVECSTQTEVNVACKAGNIAIVRAGIFSAYGSSQVTAYDSSQVRAYDSSQVAAYDSSQVRAYRSSQVAAYGSSQVTAYGSSQVKATDYVAVTCHGDAVKVSGGHIIKIISPKTVIQWCAFHGLEIKDGVVVLFKGLTSQYKANHNVFDYTPGTIPIAPDWDCGQQECGGGLHFSPYPVATLQFNSDAKKFVACPVRVSEIRCPKLNDEYPNKVKASGCCAPVWEVDINGNKI